MEIKPRTLEKLKYYIGKTVTIICCPINRNFTEIQARAHFVTIVQEISSDGIWGLDPYEQSVGFYTWQYIIMIKEETTFDPNNPEHLELLRKYEESTGKKADINPHLIPELPVIKKETPLKQELREVEKDSVPFVDITSLSKLVRQTKRSHDIDDATKQFR